MDSDARYAPFARETAMCVDFAYNAMEEDILNEMQRAGEGTRESLQRLLKRLRDRRAVLTQFTELVGSARP